jgi:hypothetical protein
MIFYFRLFLLLIFPAMVCSDLSYYRDTNAHFMGLDNLDLRTAETIYVDVSTSTAYKAGTSDTIFATYIGEFSSSGPHNLGSFAAGSSVTVQNQLDRQIGKLKSIILSNKGYDGWLLAKLSCRINSVRYELTAQVQWLDSFDPAQYEQTGNGFEPESQDPTLSAASTMALDVSGVYLVYEAFGLTHDVRL